jgi:hypothetical protein
MGFTGNSAHTLPFEWAIEVFLFCLHFAHSGHPNIIKTHINPQKPNQLTIKNPQNVIGLAFQPQCPFTPDSRYQQLKLFAG